ncbi:MAG: HAD family hydrolase [Treponema sp.]
MKTVFFDLDDTLYFRRDAFFIAVEKFFGIKESRKKNELCTFCRTRGDEVFFKAQRGEITNVQMYAYRFTKGFLDAGFTITEKEALDFQSVYQKELYSLKLSEPVIKMLDFAKNKFDALGIITNGPKDHQWNKIKNLSLEKWFSKNLIFVSGDYKIDKPDSRIFLLAQERAGKKSDDLIFVGDSFCNDILPASKLNWHTIWLNLYDEKMQPPEYSCNNVSGILKILQSCY